MIKQAIKFFFRTFKGILYDIPLGYRRTMWWILTHDGPKALYNFVFVKIFARGERVGLQLLDPLEMNFPQLTPFPYMMEIEVTTRCHLKCPHCEHTHWKDPSYKKQDLSYEDFVFIINQFPGLKYINLTGEGSSFLNKDFYYILKTCKMRNIYTTVIDSFTNLTDNQITNLVGLASKVVVSIDAATPEKYREVRKGGELATVLKNIDKFVQLRRIKPYPELVFRYTFFKDNVSELPIMPYLIKSHRVQKPEGQDNALEFTGLLEFEQTKGLQCNPSVSIMTWTKNSLKKNKIKGTWSHPESPPTRNIRECCAWAEPYIMIDGSVMPCCSVMMSNKRDFLSKNALGNVYETPFKEIWESEKYVKMRQSIPKKTGPVPLLCKGCRGFNTAQREKEYGIV